MNSLSLTFILYFIEMIYLIVSRLRGKLKPFFSIQVININPLSMSDISDICLGRFAGAVAPSTGNIMKNALKLIDQSPVMTLKLNFTPVTKRLSEKGPDS